MANTHLMSTGDGIIVAAGQRSVEETANRERELGLDRREREGQVQIAARLKTIETAYQRVLQGFPFSIDSYSSRSWFHQGRRTPLAVDDRKIYAYAPSSKPQFEFKCV
jgi:hypothetical protein